MAVLTLEKDLRVKDIMGDRQILYNDKRIILLGRHNDPKCVHTKQQSIKTHEAKTERTKGKHRHIHLILGRLPYLMLSNRYNH